MRRMRTVILLSGFAVTLGAQATTRPRTAVAGTVVRGADLVIDSLDFRHTEGIGVFAEVQDSPAAHSLAHLSRARAVSLAGRWTVRN